jgi:hypothetical protein
MAPWLEIVQQTAPLLIAVFDQCVAILPPHAEFRTFAATISARQDADQCIQLAEVR